MKIKKPIKNMILSTVLLATMATSVQSHATIGGIVAVVGGGFTTALVGLGALGASTMLEPDIESGRPNGGLILFLLGVLLLEGENEIEFQEIPKENLLKMGLTNDEAISYNDNLEELGVAFREVSNNLDKSSSKEDAIAEWEIQEDVLGSDAINAARKVLKHNLRQAK